MLATPLKLHIVLVHCWIAMLMLLQSGLAMAMSEDDKVLAGTKIAAAMQMLQSDDAQAVSRYVDNELHPDTLQSFAGSGRERYIAFLSDIKRFHRSLQLESAPQLELRNGLQQVSAHLRSANTELNYLLQLNLSAQPPFKVTMVDLFDAPAKTTAGAKLTRPQLVRQLADYVDRLAGRGVFSGAVLFADEQGVLYQSASGMADLRFQVPNNVDTRFNLASMNKMFTAISILQLAQANKLSLQDKLVRYVNPSLFASADFQHITLQQLLSHTAGIGWPDYPDQLHNQYRQLQQFRPLLKHLPLSAKPGSRYMYSNEGMLLLGMVIEQVSGLSYDAYVQQHIYAKAGMMASGNFDIDGVTPNMAMGYTYSAQLQSMQSNWFVHGVKGNSAGGGYSTVGDLYKFAKALTGYQLLSAELTQAAISAKPELNARSYGYGFSVRRGSNGVVVGHGGDFIGISSGLRIYRDKGLVLIVLGNQNFASDPVFAKAEALLQQL
ncbi:serine hydrolase domain-containing protein [Rheinheimera sp.]|uniref:serine hydrolase domain-containing protein n=1 Tax=Rheinheimera sp. TaxID=1869214 RepID=UPI003D2A7854